MRPLHKGVPERDARNADSSVQRWLSIDDDGVVAYTLTLDQARKLAAALTDLVAEAEQIASYDAEPGLLGVTDCRRIGDFSQ